MEVIQWTALWDTYKNEFDSEMVSGNFLSEKAAEDLKQRIIEHVINLFSYIYSHPINFVARYYGIFFLFLSYLCEH